MNQIRLYDLFRKELRLPDDKAAAFVKAVGDVVESEAAGKNHLLATKEDIHDLKNHLLATKGDIHDLKNDLLATKEDIHDFKNDLLATKEDIHDFKNDIHVLKKDMHVLRGDLELKIEQSKTDIYKAMFLTGIVQLIAILSGTLAIVKLMK